MRLNIHNERHNAVLNDFARNRLELAIGRFGGRISHVELQMFDETGSTKAGNDDKVCTVEITLAPRGRVFVQGKSQSMYAAVVKAAHRAETVVGKAVDRGHRSQEIRRQHGKVRDQQQAINESQGTTDA